MESARDEARVQQQIAAIFHRSPHGLPGTTYSNPIERGEYRRGARAISGVGIRCVAANPESRRPWFVTLFHSRIAEDLKVRKGAPS
jgi:hypothetical protein